MQNSGMVEMVEYVFVPIVIYSKNIVLQTLEVFEQNL